MHRRLLILLAVVMLLALPVCAEESSVVFFDDFESDSGVWYGGEADESAAADGELGLFVYNPYGEEIDGRITHLLSYMDTVPLTAGEIYRISFDIIDPMNDERSEMTSGTRFGTGVDNIVFEFAGIPGDWTEASAFFMVPRDADYSFSLELREGDAFIGFMLDNIVIEKIGLNPESLTIIGSDELTIPASGDNIYAYRAAAYTSSGEVINLLADISTMSAEDLPAGVFFDNNDNTVIVSEGCPDGAAFTLVCTPPEYLDLEPTWLEVRLTKNVLQNYDFSQEDRHWIVDGDYELIDDYDGTFISLYTETLSPYGYSAAIRPDRPVLLIGGVMYVFRAMVRLYGGSGNSIYSQNTAVPVGDHVDINILNIPDSDWAEVVTAFTPEVSGAYELSMNYFTAESGIVGISRMTLTPELPDETYITLHAPGNICVPDVTTVFPLNAYIRDQAGQVISSRCDLRIFPEGRGVELENGGISVAPDAVAGEYEIYAVSRNNSYISASLMLTVSHNLIGDGGFEERAANEWWAAAYPAELLIEGDGEKYARIYSDEDFAVVMNNSYMRLNANTPYAFRADVVAGKESVVILFIETVDGERIPVVQSETVTGRMFGLFQTETDLVGRLMLYITSEDGGHVDLSMDNAELLRSIVTASVPVITGVMEVGSVIRADFDFFNNMDDSGDDSDCAVSWYLMDSSGGEPRHVGSGSELLITLDMLGRYIYVEVTPICALTGLSGVPVQSIPVPIGALLPPDELPPHDAVRPDNPEDELQLRPISLLAAGSSPFADLDHWAEEYVLALYGSGIVSGRTETMFCPDDIITRAEFAAIVCRAFQVSGGEQHFSDVPPDAWYSDSVAALSSIGIVRGTSETRFSPDVQLNREEMLTIFVRIYESLNGEAVRMSVSRFYDNGDISDWAREYVEKGLGAGLVNGTKQSTFQPKRAATRAEACTMLYRLLKALEEEDE